MSYLLDALRKAERERQFTRLPTHAAHGTWVASRRPWWPWIIGGALLMNATVVILVLRPAPPGTPPAPSEVGGRSAVTPAPPVPEGRAAVSAAPTEPAAEPARAAVAEPEAPSGGRAVSRSAAATREPPAPPSRAEITVTRPLPSRPVESALTPPIPAPAPAASDRPSDPGAAASTPPLAMRRAQGAAPASPGSDHVAVRARAVTPGLVLGSPADDRTGRPSPAETAGAGQTGAGVLAKPAGTPVVPGGTRPVEERRRTGLPGVPNALTVLQEAAAQMTLDVLVYSDQGDDRMVFINSRKYVEGQAVVGGIVVEAIIPEGAVLSYEGQPFLLRPKSNPYLRPAP